jgi:hypothetical protein
MVSVPSLLLFFLLSLSSPPNVDSFGIKNPPPLSKICAENLPIFLTFTQLVPGRLKKEQSKNRQRVDN